MSKTRYAYLDTAKAYLIILVIFGHVLIVLNPDYSNLYMRAVQEYIYVFHMPAFLVIHGVVFNNEKWKSATLAKFVKRRAFTLLVPYLFFELIGIIWRAVFQHQSITAGLYNMVTIRCNVGADWFLPAMFLAGLLFFIYVKRPNKIYGATSTAASFILPMFMSGHQLLIVLGRAMVAYGFIMIGNLAKEWFTSEKNKSLLRLIIAALVTGAAAVINMKFGANDFYTCIISNPITLVVGGVSGTLLIICFSRFVHNHIIETVGKHTLTIMGTHQLVIYAVTALVPGMYGGSVVKGVILLTAITVFEIPTVYLLDRYLPFLVGRQRK